MSKVNLCMAMIATVSLALVGVVSCGDDDDGNVQSSSLNDAQVLGVLATANQGEVTFSQRGVDGARDLQVKAFATQMVQVHSSALARAQGLATATSLGTSESDVSAKLKSDEKDAESNLDAVSEPGLEWDLHFMCAEVRMHRGVLKTIDDSLLPSVKNARVRTEVTNTRPVVAQHLQEAENLVTKIGGSTSGGDAGTADAGTGNDGGVGRDAGTSNDGGVNGDGGTGGTGGTTQTLSADDICKDRGGAS
jgi:putative membrane protein